MTAAGDLDQIKALLLSYLDGLHHGDVARLEAAFHPVAHLISVEAGEVRAEPRDAWLARVAARPSAAAQGLSRHDAILSIDISGPQTAFAKVACAMPPRFFTDTCPA